MDAQTYTKSEGLRCAVCANLLTAREVELIRRDTDFVAHGRLDHLIRIERPEDGVPDA